ncbi:lamin tail domain-containing protein [Streptomyces sp. NPDC002671]
MKNRTAITALAAMTAVLGIAMPAHATGTTTTDDVAAIRFVSVHWWDPSSNGMNTYVQFKNTGTQTVDLSGATLETLDQDNGVRYGMNFDPGTRLAPGKTMVVTIGGRPRLANYYAWTSEFGAFYKQLSLRPANHELYGIGCVLNPVPDYDYDVHTGPKSADSFCSGYRRSSVRMAKVYSDSPGSDTGTNSSLNAEYVQLKNYGTTDVKIGGDTIYNGVDSLYKLPTFTLKPGKTVTVRTGKGTNTTSTLYMNRTSYFWPNRKSSGFLSDSSNRRLSNCSYDDSEHQGWQYCTHN